MLAFSRSSARVKHSGNSQTGAGRRREVQRVIQNWRLSLYPDEGLETFGQLHRNDAFDASAPCVVVPFQN